MRIRPHDLSDDGFESGDYAVQIQDGVVGFTPLPDGGGAGGDTPAVIRSDVASPYAYIGTAPVGTADADAGWLVSRIHLTAHETQTATGAWDDRAVLPYES